MLRALVYSNVYVAVCAASLVTSTYAQLGMRPRLDAAFGLVFFATLLVYNLDRIAGTSPEDLPTEDDAPSRRHDWIERRRRVLGGLAALGALGSAVCGLALPWVVMLALFPLAALTFAYTLPLIPTRAGMRRLKDVPGVKIFLIAVVWATATVSIPVWARGVEPWGLAPLEVALERALFILAITLPFDVRDLEKDRRAGLRTIPHVLGVQWTRALAIGSLVVLGGWSAWRHGLSMGDPGLGVVACCVASAALLAALDTTRGEDYYAVGVEGTMLLHSGLVVLSVATGW